MWSAYILSILAFSCSAQYLFAVGWIFLDLWVSSSALLLNCMCFFDFMFPFQVTAFDIWLVLLLSPLRQVVATTNCWKEILNWNWVYPLSFSLRLNISGFVSVFKRSAPRLHVLLWLHVSVESDGLRYLTRDAAPSSTSSGRNHIVEKLLSIGIGLIFSSLCFK